jgi:hypothetical protein
MMLFMIIAVLGIVVVIGLVASTVGRLQLPRQSAPSEEGRLAEQAQRIELLEEELQRVKDQADFTERLLVERGSGQPGGRA